MTESDVRALFFKNYSVGDLNEALIASMEEISMAIIREVVEEPESLPEIVRTIAVGKSHIALFRGMKNETKLLLVQENYYLFSLDTICKAMTDVVRYTRDNLETMKPWFRERFKKEHLEAILNEIVSAIEMTSERPANTRTFNPNTIKFYDEFFSTALVGIIGPDNFMKYLKEYNRCVKTLRQCQAESKAFSVKVWTRES